MTEMTKPRSKWLNTSAAIYIERMELSGLKFQSPQVCRMFLLYLILIHKIFCLYQLLIFQTSNIHLYTWHLLSLLTNCIIIFDILIFHQGGYYFSFDVYTSNLTEYCMNNGAFNGTHNIMQT